MLSTSASCPNMCLYVLASCCDVRYDSTCSIRLYPQLLVGGLMSYLCFLCLLVYSGVEHVLTIRITLHVSFTRQVLVTLREYLVSAIGYLGVRFAHLYSFFVFVLCLVCPMFPVSLDCQFLIVPSVFSIIYLRFQSHVAIIKTKVLLPQS